VARINAKTHHFTTHSPQETQDIAYKIAQVLGSRGVICLFGDLGAGKTTFVKGILNDPSIAVVSPTYTYLNIYPGNPPLYHFDLYRLKGEEEFLSMGFEEYFWTEGICCVEWSEKITQILPPEAVQVTLVSLEHSNQRKIEVVFPYEVAF